MRLIIKINKLQVWEFEVDEGDEFSVEFSKSNGVPKKVLEAEKAMFELFRKQYPGPKRGLKTEFDYFTKKIKDWKEVLPQLVPSIMIETNAKAKQKYKEGFAPSWKNLQSWIYNRRWEMEYETKPTPELKTITFQTE